MEINVTAITGHLKSYDLNNDGKLDENEIQEMQKTTAQIGTLLTGGAPVTEDKDKLQVQRAQSLVIRRAAKKLAASISDNKSSEIFDNFSKFADSVSKEDGFQCLETDEQRLAYILNKFEQITGQDIETMIDENAHGSFVSGLINSVTWGFAHDKSNVALKKAILDGESPKKSFFEKYSPANLIDNVIDLIF